ncbi:MAG: ABC transporter ATP-binding protein [Hyphomicrobiaceae bacterium]
MPETAVELNAVTLAYGRFVAVDNVSLSIDKGSFVTLLGPSGCGKTTILRSIAGLVDPTAGDIRIMGRRVNDIPIHKRNIGLVFQNYALFPHKTVHDNIAFGLKYRGVAKDVIAGKVARALEMVRLPGVEKKLPSEMSGGQQQRIALARAIVIEPDVLLLDEPLSALDANLREEMRIELKAIQREVGITTIFVTHDQEEALAMSDRVIVMNHGVVEQAGTPEEVYRWPATEFVARFLGQSNLLAGRIAGRDGSHVRIALEDGPALLTPAKSATDGQKVTAVVRAQRIAVEGGSGAAGDGRIAGKIAAISYLGGTVGYQVAAGRSLIQVIAMAGDRILKEGDAVTLTVRPEDVVLLDEAGRRIPAA